MLAGWAREQVCTYMCPWPRFQAAMLDEQSVIVTYQKWRGEPRGKHKAGDGWEGRGDCVDCSLCVAVCPTGIDIRDGQQIECIGCGLCIDACNQTMSKVDRPRDLIRWDTLADQQARESGGSGVAWRPVRPRTLLYAALLGIVAAVMLAAFVLRTDTELTVQRDPLDGLPSATLGFIGAEVEGSGPATHLVVHPDAVGTFRVFVTVPSAAAPAGSKSVEFIVRDESGRERASHDAVFVGAAR